MNHLPIEFRDIAAEIQDEELARAERQERAADRLKDAHIQALEDSKGERKEHISAD